MDTAKPTIPEVLDRFVAYKMLPGNGVWGSLHSVLDDLNVRDKDVRGAIEWAQERGDAEGAALGEILLRMGQTQRRRLASLAEDEVDRVEAERKAQGVQP